MRAEEGVSVVGSTNLGGAALICTPVDTGQLFMFLKEQQRMNEPNKCLVVKCSKIN